MLTPLYQWLRGQLTDLGAEFTRLSDSLAACPGAQGGILATVTRSSSGSLSTSKSSSAWSLPAFSS